MNITVKVEGIKEALEKFDPKVVGKAAVSTMNEVIKSTRTFASDIIRNERGFKILKSDFDKRVEMKPARMNDLTAVLTVHRISAKFGWRTGKDSFALTYFGAKEARRTSVGVTIKSRKGIKKQKRTGMGSGVTVQVLKGGTVARFPHAFIATMKSGHIGVFRRVEGKAATGKQKIAERKVITLATMFRGTLPKLREHALQKFKERFPGKLEWANRK